MINLNNIIERNKLFKILSLIYFGLHKENEDFLKSVKPYIDTAINLQLIELTEDNILRLTAAGLFAIDNDYQINRIDFVTLIKRLLKGKEYNDSNKVIVLLSIGLNIAGRTSNDLLKAIVDKITKPNLQRLQKLITNRLVIMERGNDLDKDNLNDLNYLSI
jgi:hypothetical protein